MPRFQATVRSPWTAARTFAYLADLEHFAEWDPGTLQSERVPDPGVAAAGLRRDRLDVRPPRSPSATRWSRRTHPGACYLVAENSDAPTRRRRSRSPRPTTAASSPTTASLTLPGPLRLLDPLFAPGFRRTVDRGAAGLAAVLEELPCDRRRRAARRRARGSGRPELHQDRVPSAPPALPLARPRPLRPDRPGRRNHRCHVGARPGRGGAAGARRCDGRRVRARARPKTSDRRRRPPVRAPATTASPQSSST